VKAQCPNSCVGSVPYGLRLFCHRRHLPGLHQLLLPDVRPLRQNFGPLVGLVVVCSMGRWSADLHAVGCVTLGRVVEAGLLAWVPQAAALSGVPGKMPCVYTGDVAKLLERFRPESILQVDPDGTEVFSRYLETSPACRIDRLARGDIRAQLQGKGRYAFSFVANTLEHLKKETAGQIIARLRDIHSERLFVVVPVGSDWEGLASTWEMSDFVAFGMRLIASYTTSGKRLQMYKFDIVDYKNTPDWLSSKHWAHPQRWDKERW